MSSLVVLLGDAGLTVSKGWRGKTWKGHDWAQPLEVGSVMQSKFLLYQAAYKGQTDWPTNQPASSWAITQVQIFLNRLL